MICETATGRRESIWARAAYLCGMLLLVLLTLREAIGQDSEFDHVYQEAAAAQASGNLPKAIQNYERLVQLRPDMAEAWANLGSLCYQQGNLPEATRALRRASALKPELAGPFYFLGVIAFEKGAAAEAIPPLRRASLLEPSNPLPFAYLGYALLAQGATGSAFEALSKAVELHGADANVLYRLSEAASGLAEDAFSRLDKQYPDSAFADFRHAQVYESKRDWCSAATFLSRASVKLPGNAALSGRLAWVRAQSDSGGPNPDAGDELVDGSLRFIYTPLAPAELEPALRSEIKVAETAGNRSPEGLYQKAEAFQSVSLLSSLLLSDRFADSFQSHQLRGKMLAAQSRLDEAITEYKTALTLQPEAPDLHFAIGNIYWQQGRLDDAKSELALEQKRNPRNAFCSFELGDIAYREQRTDDAARLLAQSVALRPTLREAWLDLAKLHEGENEPDRSIADERKAIALAPEDPAAHYALMRLLKRENRNREAAAELATYQHLKTKADANAPKVSVIEKP